MPLVRIDLASGRSAEIRRSIGEIVYKAMIDVINVPADDKFQIITEHGADDLNFARSYLGVAYSPGIVFIQITLNAGRSVDLKKAFYKQIADDLHAQLAVRKEDVFINLIEVAKENWSFGNGVAQYAQ
jgi:4-oxalocrotonate tautomerase